MLLTLHSNIDNENESYVISVLDYLLLIFFYFLFRALSSVPQTAKKNVPKGGGKERSLDSKAVESNSFVMNTFLGKHNTSQVFPYPDALSADQKETLQMLVDPTRKFFEEVNDAARNDREGKPNIFIF